MDIINFKRIRVGSHYPQTLDVSPIDAHESDGLYAAFQAYPELKAGMKRAELRCKGEAHALFLFRYEDMELPDWWKDSELLWELKES